MKSGFDRIMIVATAPGPTAFSSLHPGAILALISVLFGGSPVVTQAQASFVHPGLLHTQADLNRIKSMVASNTDPYKKGFDVFASHPQSRSTYAVQGGFKEMGRNPNVNMGQAVTDCNAAYQNALMWAITGNRAYADKSIRILDVWSANLTTISGKDAILAAGIYGFKLVNAAEIIRYTNAGWAPASITRAEGMFKNVFYPVIKDFATFANGNWELACVQTMMGIGVFTNDTAIFNRAVNWYYHGSYNGTLTHYVINEAGQCQESGRDQTHTQLGLGMLAACAEIGWNQGLDMYGAEADRLLKGFEYTAKYNLGNSVPFQEYTDFTRKYHQTAISPLTRGALRPIYEMVYYHFANRRGLPASSLTYTKQAAEQLRPERDAAQADNIGFGTLLFTRPYGLVDVGVLSADGGRGQAVFFPRVWDGRTRLAQVRGSTPPVIDVRDLMGRGTLMVTPGGEATASRLEGGTRARGFYLITQRGTAPSAYPN